MKKSIGYMVFRGYSPRHFYFFNRDTKNSLIRVNVNDLANVKSLSYPVDLADFEIE